MVSVVPLFAIMGFFKEDEKQIKRGENAMNSNHVMGFQFLPEVMGLKGTVHASMRDRSYNVEVHLGKEVIKEARCTCARGEHGRCHHVAALLLFGHKEISRTDVACKWSQPKKDAPQNKGLPIDDLSRKGKPVEAVAGALSRRDMKEVLKSHHMCEGAAVHMKWLMEAAVYGDPPTASHQVSAVAIPSIADAIQSPGFAVAESKISYLQSYCDLSWEKISNIASATVGQASNPLWTEARTHRITASSFGNVLRNVRSGRPSTSLLPSLCGNRDLGGIKEVKWGREHEATAIKMFEAQAGLCVSATGVWLHRSGALGASPDGFIGSGPGHVLEVKCPWRFRDTDMRQGLTGDHKYIVRYNDGEWVLNKSHTYYHQMQGQIFFSDSQSCILALYAPKQKVAIVPVPREESWEENIDKLLEFYEQKYIPFAFPVVQAGQ